MGKAERYVVARLAGQGTRAGARSAGFAASRPSQDARALWKRVVALREVPGLTDALHAERRRLAAQRARLSQAEATQRAWDRALGLLLDG